MRYTILDSFRNAEVISEEDQRELWIIRCNLGDLERFVGAFGADLILFRFSTERAELEAQINGIHVVKIREWARIAARDGALNVYHVVMTIAGIERTLAKMPDLRDRLDMKNFRDARRSLREAFPDFEYLRHAFAHAGEKGSDSKAFTRHSASGAYHDNLLRIDKGARGVMLTGAIAGEKITETYEGKIVSYNMSEASLEALKTTNRKIQFTFGRVE